MSEIYNLDVVAVRLVPETPIISKIPITSPESAVAAVGKYMENFDREIVCVINLNSKGSPINCSICSIGAINKAIVAPREILKSSILSNAANVIVLHNHPSGDIAPSLDDIKTTKILYKSYEMLGIQLLDHLIIGKNGSYYSFKANDMLNYENVVKECTNKEIGFDGVFELFNKKQRRNVRL